MKSIRNILIGFVATLMLVVFVWKAHAASVNAVCPYNTYTNVLLSGSARVTSFTFANGTGTNTFVQLFDNNSSNLFYTNLSYTYTHYSLGTATNLYTNYFGVVVSNNFSALVASTTTVASNNTLNGIVLGVAVPANTTTVVNGQFRFLSGIQATNGLGQVSVTAVYQ